MPMVTGKNASDAEITAFGSSPENPAWPSTTTIIGAVASTGMDCETITQGSNPRSSSRECTIIGGQCDADDGGQGEAGQRGLQRDDGVVDQAARAGHRIAEQAVPGGYDDLRRRGQDGPVLPPVGGGDRVMRPWSSGGSVAGGFTTVQATAQRISSAARMHKGRQDAVQPGEVEAPDAGTGESESPWVASLIGVGVAQGFADLL